MTNTLGEKIRTLRKEKEYTLDKLAELTKSSKSYIWELEQGRIPRPSVEKIQKVADVLGVTPAFLTDPQKEKPADHEVDHAFFRKYRKLPPDTKKKIRQLIDVWSKG